MPRWATQAAGPTIPDVQGFQMERTTGFEPATLTLAT